MPVAPCFLSKFAKLGAPHHARRRQKSFRRAVKRAGLISSQCTVFPISKPPPGVRDYATLGARLRELRWKNSAWLATAETIAGWNGFEIRNAGSGRSPVRKRSG